MKTKLKKSFSMIKKELGKEKRKKKAIRLSNCQLLKQKKIKKE